jgi:hypothetical protein
MIIKKDKSGRTIVGPPAYVLAAFAMWLGAWLLLAWLASRLGGSLSPFLPGSL